MSALAHCFEGDGLATVIVALVREHVVAMRPPRALWVPFELGRPFAAPQQPDLQRRILGEALGMLDLPGPGPLLNEFDAEDFVAADDPDWRPPAGLDRRSLETEAVQVAEIWSALAERSGRTTVGLSGLAPPQAVAFVARYHDPEPVPNPKGMARVSRARFAIDDIKACYLEAAASAGIPSSRQLHDWFWEQSLAGAMIKRFQDRARHSEDTNLRLISGSLVPAERTLSFTR